jgi:hypothetical protein
MGKDVGKLGAVLIRPGPVRKKLLFLAYVKPFFLDSGLLMGDYRSFPP